MYRRLLNKSRRPIIREAYFEIISISRAKIQCKNYYASFAVAQNQGSTPTLMLNPWSGEYDFSYLVQSCIVA